MIALSRAQAQTQYNLDLQRLTWNHSTINVLIVPEDSASWWQASYLNATLRAIGEWNNAIQAFALNYSNFAYLSSLRIDPTVSQTLEYGFDVYVSWARIIDASSDAIGITGNMYSPSGIIINSTITLAAESSLGYIPNEVDMQNVALHELGHSLGLGHSNYSGDIMYPSVTVNQPVKGLSTLDLFGVSTVFQWMSDSSDSPYRPRQSSVTLPSSIEYLVLSISYENLPPQTASPFPSQTSFAWGQAVLTLGQALLTYISQFFLHPIILISLLAAISALIVAKFVIARVVHKSYPAEPSG
jgi:predicted Zn-dependent protease